MAGRPIRQACQGRSRRRRPMSEINVVPYIDVMLVLLVIFMVTAPLLNQGVEVELPQASAKPLENSQDEPVVVSVDTQGLYYLNIGDDPEKPIEPKVLVARVAAVLRRRPSTPVLVRGDREVDYGQVVLAMTLLQNAGAPSIGLMTDPPPPSR